MNSITKTCYKEDCDRPFHARDRCKMHLHRFYKYGDDDFAKIKCTNRGEPPKFFEEAVILETDDCIVWPYALHRGYGLVTYKSKQIRVHRLALQRRVGPAPPGKPHALHKPLVCHHPACFNYRHLYWGSQRDNLSDAIIDGTTTRGVKNPQAKLNEEDVIAIRADVRLHRVIAVDYGVTKTCIRVIKSGENWGWL